MAIPLRDQNPTRRFPLITVALIAVNLFVFFALQLPKQSTPSSYINPLSKADEQNFEYGAIPCELREGHPLTRAEFVTQQCGVTVAAVARPGVGVFPNKNVWLAVLFSMFMHASVVHVLGNMLFLWIFGNNVEDRLGPLVFVLFYVGTGIAAAAAQFLSDPTSTAPFIGASGAIAGVMGAYIVWFPHARVLTFVPVLFFLGLVELPAVVVLGLWLVMQFFTNPNEGVAWLAHVGGFVAGAAVAFALHNANSRPPP